MKRRGFLKMLTLLPFFAFLKPAEALTDREMLAKFPMFKTPIPPIPEFSNLYLPTEPTRVRIVQGGNAPGKTSRIALQYINRIMRK